MDKAIIEYEGTVPSVFQLIEHLKAWNCPKNIVELLETWQLDLYIDKVKLEKWQKREGI